MGSSTLEAESGNSVDIKGQINGSGSLTFTGQGAFNVTGEITNTGNATINGPTVTINTTTNQSLSVTAGVLKGAGSIASLTATSGSIQPGNSIGTLTVTGDYTQNGAELEIEVDSEGKIDFTDIDGNASDLETKISFLDNGSYTPNKKFTFLEADGNITGDFRGLPIKTKHF